MLHKKEKALEMKNSFELRDCSFQPQINKMLFFLMKNLNNIKLILEAKSLIMRKKKYLKNHIPMIDLQNYMKLLLNINRKKKKKDFRNDFLKKYFNICKRVDNKYSYHPKLNRNSLHLMENQDFFSRLEKDSVVRFEKLKMYD